MHAGGHTGLQADADLGDRTAVTSIMGIKMPRAMRGIFVAEKLLCDCGALGGATPVVAHRDVHIDVSMRSLEAEHERLSVFAGLDAFCFGVQLRRRDLKAE